MKMGQFTERGRFVFDAGGSLNDAPPVAVTGANSVIGFVPTDLRRELLRMLLERSEIFCPLTRAPIALAIGEALTPQ